MRVLVIFFFFTLLTACASEKNKSLVKAQGQSCQELEVGGQWVVKFKDRTHPRLIQSRDTEFTLYSRHQDIEWAERNYRLPAPKPIIKPFIENDSTHSQKYMAMIRAEYGWSMGYLGQGIVVAVVDSGIDIEHPRLKNNILINAAENNKTPDVDDDGNGFVDDIYGWNFVASSPAILDESGHGTHIAGIIAATHNTNTDTKGIAPQADLLVVDFVDGETGDEFAAMEGLRYALSRGAKVVNNSWSSLCSQFLRNAFEGWQNTNVIFVNSSGNDYTDLYGYPLYPASLDFANHITVGAFDSSFKKADFSNYGPTVKVLAPGETIVGITPHTESEGIAFRSGTSMSAGFVSGAIAAAWGLRPDLQAQVVVSIFQQIHAPAKAGDNPKILDIREFIMTVRDHQ